MKYKVRMPRILVSRRPLEVPTVDWDRAEDFPICSSEIYLSMSEHLNLLEEFKEKHIIKRKPGYDEPGG